MYLREHHGLEDEEEAIIIAMFLLRQRRRRQIDRKNMGASFNCRAVISWAISHFNA